MIKKTFFVEKSLLRPEFYSINRRILKSTQMSSIAMFMWYDVLFSDCLNEIKMT
jgi:hypothetical protein